jgi:outer membrane protein TolC
MHLKRTWFVAVLSSLLCLGAAAAEPTPRALSLADCIQIALEHNLDVQIERYSPEIARYSVSLGYAAFEPELSFAATHSFRADPGGIDAQGRTFQGTETKSDAFSGGLRGLIPTGLSYNLTVGVSDAFGTRPGFDPTVRVPFEVASGRWSLFEVRQPLLRNFWIDNTRFNILISKNRLRQTEQQFRLQLMRTILNVEIAYYNVIQARENVKNQQKALELAERLLAENKKRVEVGALAPLDEKQAESQVAQRQADLLAAQNNLYVSENALKNLLSDDFTEWSGVRLEPTETLAVVLQPLDVQASWEKGLELRPELRQLRLDVARTGIVLRYQKNQLFPVLDVVGSYGWLGSGAEFSDALGQLRDADNVFYSYGAELRIPLGNRAARRNYQISKAERQQVLLQLKQLEQNIMIEIDNAVKQAQTAFESVDATRKAREYAEAALQAEEKKLANGKSTSFVVLQLQRDLTAARTAEIAALADYNKALAQLAFSEGATLEKNKLTLEIR